MTTKTYAGLDMHKEAKRLWKLLGHKDNLPTLVFRQGRSPYASGRCQYWRHRVVVTFGTDQANNLAVLAHELVHADLGCKHDYGTGRTQHHGLRFYSRWFGLMSRAWPEASFDWHTKRGTEAGWKLTAHGAARLRAHLQKETTHA